MQKSKLTKEEIYQNTRLFLSKPQDWALDIDAETQGIVWEHKVDGLRIVITTDLGYMPEDWNEGLKFKTPICELNQMHHIFGRYSCKREDAPRELFHVSTDSVTHIVEGWAATAKAVECIQEGRELTTRNFY